MEKVKMWLKQPSTKKGILAVAAAISIFMYPEFALQTVGGFLAIYGMYQTGRDENK